MGKLKWRIILSLGNMILSAGLFQTGMHQFYAAKAAHPGMSYHGNWYVPVAHQLNNAIYAPSRIAAFLLQRFRERTLGWHVEWAPLGPWEFYICVFLFWCLVGWHIDVREKPLGQRHRNRPCLVAVAFYGFVLIYAGVTSLGLRIYMTLFERLATCTWAILLLIWSLLGMKTLAKVDRVAEPSR